MTAQTLTQSPAGETTERFDPIGCLDERVRNRAEAIDPPGPGRYLEVQGSERALLIRLEDGVLHIGRGLSAGPAPRRELRLAPSRDPRAAAAGRADPRRPQLQRHARQRPPRAAGRPARRRRDRARPRRAPLPGGVGAPARADGPRRARGPRRAAPSGGGATTGRQPSSAAPPTPPGGRGGASALEREPGSTDVSRARHSCRLGSDPSMIRLRNSLRSLMWGRGSSGTGSSRNSHSGSQPSVTLPHEQPLRRDAGLDLPRS